MVLAFCLVALLGLSVPAEAAGLGKVVVFSGLGQPLRAEIEVAATREELSGMRVRLAPQEEFQRVGLDYAASLQQLHFIIEQRGSEHVVINLLSITPINDPFIDLLLEVDWPSGHLVREYTFLLDPPESLSGSDGATGPLLLNLPELPADAAPVASPVVAGAETPQEGAIDAQAEVAEAAEAASESVLTAVGGTQERAAKGSEPTTAAATLRKVKRGDTLSKIALSIKPDGVSLEQMLVSLYRANQAVFDGANMNRLRAGKVLVIPNQPELDLLSRAAAKKIVQAQAADWNSYRKKLATLVAQMPVKDDPGKQNDAGKVTAKVEDKEVAAVTARDQLKLSPTEIASLKPGTSEEDLVAKRKALKEANERLVLLEKNVANLQKLLDQNQKSMKLEEKQSQAAEKMTPVGVNKALDTSKAKKKQKLPPV
jgi:pilus assembly protein FimV